MPVPKPVISFNREFQIWNYTISHGQLLLRSPKTTDRSTRIDILFSDVRVSESRMSFQTITIEEAEFGDVVERATKPLEVMETGLRVFLLKCKNWTGYVLAGAVHWHEDEGEYGQPSALLNTV